MVMPSLVRMIVAFLLLLGSPFGLAEPLSNGRGFDPSSDGPTLKPFAPGVRIDWKARTVEVDAEIALHEGPLELLVCALNTREHESVFVTKARPMHIFQALGLVGFEQGRPARYEKEGDRMLPPSGDRIDILVRFADSGAVRRPEELVRQSADRKSPAALQWVFAGSRLLPDGRFAADGDGTVACVVDFDSALIAVDSSHSSDNELLWLEANPDTLPKRGTPCTLIFSRGDRSASRIEVSVDTEGRLVRNGQPLSVEALARTLRESGTQSVVLLRSVAGVSVETAASVRRKLIAAGVSEERIIDVDLQPVAVPPKQNAGNP